MSSRGGEFAACLLLGVGLAVAPAGCADWSRGVSEVDAGASGDGASGDGASGDGGVAFAGVVHPLLLDGCRACHQAEGEAGRTTFLLTGTPDDDYAATVAFVDVSAPDSSRLLAKMSGAGHGGGAVFANGSPEYATVLR